MSSNYTVTPCYINMDTLPRLPMLTFHPKIADSCEDLHVVLYKVRVFKGEYESNRAYINLCQ